jgi:hypothetical protein
MAGFAGHFYFRRVHLRSSGERVDFFAPFATASPALGPLGRAQLTCSSA